jgi:formamidopyrimidine-DNA glycosylase
MTGSLRAFTRAPARGAHDHFDLVLDSGITLRYRDPRRFGALLWVRPPAARHPLLASLGPEPFDVRCDARYLWRATRRRTAAIKLALNRVSLARYERLVGAVRETLADAIAKGGSTLRDYVDSGGAPGYFQLEYRVYGREGLPCRVCGTAIKSVRQGGRATAYCPRCQR